MERMWEPSDISLLLKNVVGMDGDPVPLHEPTFCGKEWMYVKDCLDTGWVSSAGGYVRSFEEALTEYTGIGHATAVVNGTAALHLALLLAGVAPGDEVLVPALTFVATANAVHYCGAIPHFIDCSLQSLGADPVKLDDYLKELTRVRNRSCVNLKTGRTVKALVVMHTFGHPADLDPLLEVCEKYGLVLVEDAAEALGSFYKNRHVGSYGKLATLSFNGNKIITTGGGGAILTNDPELARQAAHLSTTAKLPHAWNFVHDRVGYNYRMPNLNAALGCAQLEQLELFLRRKRALAEIYRKTFDNMPGIRFFTEPGYARSNYWLNVLVLEEEWAELREPLLQETNRQGLMTRPAWRLPPKLPMYRECPHMELSAAESLERRIINIPSGAGLTGEGERVG